MDWTSKEQACIVEQLIRGWAMTRLKPLLDEFELLEVEQERAFTLLSPAMQAGWPHVMFQFTPDAVLRHRATGAIEVLSFKTTSSWSWRTMMSYKLDQQAISEVVGMRLSANPMQADGAHMEYAVKGMRRNDNRLGWKVTYNPMVRGWRNIRENQVTAEDHTQWAWSWTFPGTDPKTGEPKEKRLSAHYWKPIYVWEDYPGGAKAWASALSRCEIQPECGSALEGMFFTPAEPVYKQEHELSSWLRQTRAKERGIREGERRVREVIEAGDSEGFWAALDEEFDQNTDNCVGWYGGLCPMHHLCHGPMAVRENALGSGLYVLREPHHSEGDGGED
jgi:hypothetical protein